MVTTSLERLTTALATRYGVDRELGAGGMATVYLAHDLKHEREVAIKVLHPDLGAALGGERFLAEIKTTARLQHPHILPLLDSGEADGLLYYVMPYVRGETLRARLQRGPIPLSEAIDVLRNVLQALQYAHAAGVVHRDIKPENILLTSGTAVVADFGIAKALTASRTLAQTGAGLTQAGTTVGTPAYMAPEQAAGDPDTNHRADLYAWAVMAYEVLAARHPFADHVTPHALITAHLTETPKPVSALQQDTPASLAAAIMSCLAKSPADRPPKAEEVLAIIDSGRTPPARPITVVRRSRRLVATLLVLSLVAAVAWWWPRRDLAPAAPKSIAVLPFEMLADSASVYVADGLSAELTTRLAKVPGLAVRAYSSSKMLRGMDPKGAAGELGVGLVVTATVRRQNDRLHVSASLVSAKDAQIVWSESFTERDQDQFALQARLAESIARALRLRLSPDTRRAVAATTTSDPIAHDLVQRSVFLADQVTPEALTLAVAMAEQAVARDSNYVDAWLALARAWMFRADDILPGVEVLAPISMALDRASQLDPQNAEVLATAGTLHEWYTRDTTAAVDELRRALSIDSTNAMALVAYASHVYVSDPDSAGKVTAAAIRNNPTTTLSLYFTLWAPSVFRVLPADSARLACTRLRGHVPPLGQYCEAARLAVAGKRAEAVRTYNAVDTTTFPAPSIFAWRALTASIIGDTLLTRSALESTERVLRGGYVREDAPAVAAARIGDRATAMRWARRAVASHVAGSIYLVGPDFRSFRGDPEYDALIAGLYRRTKGRP